MTEMTWPTKSPSMIEKTQSMQWKTMEMIQKPTKCCLWTDFVSVVGLFDPDLLFFFSIADIFCGVDWLFFVVVLAMNDCLKMKLYNVACLVLFVSNVSKLCEWIC